MAVALPCSRLSAAPALDDDHLTFGVGGKSVLSCLPLTAAERLGYLRDEGLTVEISDRRGREGAAGADWRVCGSRGEFPRHGDPDAGERVGCPGRHAARAIPGIVLAVQKDRLPVFVLPVPGAAIDTGLSSPCRKSEPAITFFRRRSTMGLSAAAVAPAQPDDVEFCTGQGLRDATTPAERTSKTPRYYLRRLHGARRGRCGAVHPRWVSAAMLMPEASYSGRDPLQRRAVRSGLGVASGPP